MMNSYLAQQKAQDLHRAADNDRLARSVRRSEESASVTPRHTWSARFRSLTTRAATTS